MRMGSLVWDINNYHKGETKMPYLFSQGLGMLLCLSIMVGSGYMNQMKTFARPDNIMLEYWSQNRARIIPGGQIIMAAKDDKNHKDYNDHRDDKYRNDDRNHNDHKDRS